MLPCMIQSLPLAAKVFSPYHFVKEKSKIHFVSNLRQSKNPIRNEISRTTDVDRYAPIVAKSSSAEIFKNH